eukprot:364509-Chlamydomonas_euryale.AAC.14
MRTSALDPSVPALPSPARAVTLSPAPDLRPSRPEPCHGSASSAPRGPARFVRLHNMSEQIYFCLQEALRSSMSCSTFCNRDGGVARV